MPTRTLRRLWVIIEERELNLIAAGIAFFAFLALFPALAAMIAIWGFFADPVVIRADLDLLRDYLPAESFDLVAGQVDTLLSLNSSSLGWATALSFGFALWSARSGVAALIRGLNAIHNLPNRGGLGHQLRALILTLLLMALVLAAVLASVVGPIALSYMPQGVTSAPFLDGLQVGLGLLLVIAAIAVAYRLGPNHGKRKRRLFTWGLLAAVIGWGLASRGLVLYVAHFDTYNRIYGSIGAVVAFLIWLYASSFAVLLGAAIDAARMRFGDQ